MAASASAARLDVVVEREGAEDVLAAVPYEAAAAEVLALVQQASGVGEEMMWELVVGGRVCDLEETLTLEHDERIVLRMKQCYIAREELRLCENIHPVTGEHLRTALLDERWDLVRLILDSQTLDTPTVKLVLTDALMDVSLGLSSLAVPMTPDEAVARVNLLVEAGADVNGTSRTRRPPLLNSIERGRTAVALQLLRLGADYTVRDQFGKTAVIYAAAAGDNDVLHEVLTLSKKHIGFVDAKTYEGRSALMLAARAGQRGTCRALIDAGADVNAYDDVQETALFAAVGSGRVEMCLLLIQHGAMVDARDSAGRTPLTHAAASGNTAVVQLFARVGADVHAGDHSGRTALHAAAVGGHVGVVKDLLARGAHVDVVDKDGTSALMFTVRDGHRAVCEVLLVAGASAVLCDFAQLTPLMYASESTNTDVARALLKAGAHPAAADANGATPLMYAAALGNNELAKLLLETGVVVNTADVAGRTALVYAASGGHAATAQTLLDRGADANVRDVRGYTPMRYALLSGCGSQLPRVCHVLVAAGAVLDCPDLEVGDEEGDDSIGINNRLAAARAASYRRGALDTRAGDGGAALYSSDLALSREPSAAVAAILRSDVARCPIPPGSRMRRTAAPARRAAPQRPFEARSEDAGRTCVVM